MAEVKYSAEDLEEFKALIEKKLDLAREDLVREHQCLTRMIIRQRTQHLLLK